MLEELQSLSEANKKKVLIIATVIIMIIVVGIWIAYFNSIVVGGASQQSTAQATSTSAGIAGTAIVAVAAQPAAASQPAGASLWQNIKNSFASFANIFQKSSNYTIQPQ
jgi:type IV secretory pathway TrbL component